MARNGIIRRRPSFVARNRLDVVVNFAGIGRGLLWLARRRLLGLLVTNVVLDGIWMITINTQSGPELSLFAIRSALSLASSARMRTLSLATESLIYSF
jgi:hypothetical protein